MWSTTAQSGNRYSPRDGGEGQSQRYALNCTEFSVVNDAMGSSSHESGGEPNLKRKKLRGRFRVEYCKGCMEWAALVASGSLTVRKWTTRKFPDGKIVKLSS